MELNYSQKAKFLRTLTARKKMFNESTRGDLITERLLDACENYMDRLINLGPLSEEDLDKFTNIMVAEGFSEDSLEVLKYKYIKYGDFDEIDNEDLKELYYYVAIACAVNKGKLSHELFWVMDNILSKLSDWYDSPELSRVFELKDILIIIPSNLTERATEIINNHEYWVNELCKERKKKDVLLFSNI